MQGDIEGILDQNGVPVVEYTYDAWGKTLTVTGSKAKTVGLINPMRYRDYYFDTETGYYYLQSRYYNPEFCRFINADELTILGTSGTILGYNLFAYCENNPVNYIDPTGKIANAIVGAGVGAVIAAATYFVEYWLGMRKLNWWHFAGVVATGAATGAVGEYISGWAKFAKTAKHAKLPKYFKKLKSPLVRNLVNASVKGMKFAINSYIKKLTRKNGESWVSAVKRWLNV